MAHIDPEQPTLTLHDSLPPSARGWLWLPHSIVTLTLPQLDGSHTAFTIHRQPYRKLYAYNVACYRQPEPMHGQS